METLPDEILCKIICKLDCLDDLISSLKVNKRWWTLTSRHLGRIKKLKLTSLSDVHINQDDNLTLYHLLSRTSCVANYIKPLPNLQIVETEELEHHQWQSFANILKHRWRIVGLIYGWSSILPDEIKNNLVNIEMLSVGKLQFKDSNYQSTWYSKVKQLHLRWCDGPHLAEISRAFCNLRRLHINIYNGEMLSCYQGPCWENLIILELTVWRDPLVSTSQPLLDYCPKLRNLFLKLESINYNYQPKNVHSELINLVIEYRDGDQRQTKSCQDLIDFILKFPNLRNLAIRGNSAIDQTHVTSLINCLPNLGIFDIRGCQNFQSSTINLENIPKTDGTTITLLTGPKSSELRFSKTNDLKSNFMANIFFTNFDMIPTFCPFPI